jgi:hypothetical protein
MTGSLSCLNVGMGDIEIVFNQHDSGERERALKMLLDMRSRGYAIIVRLDDGSYVRAVDIDTTRGRYIVQMPEDATHEAAEPLPAKSRRGRPPKSAIPVEKAHATGIARSAGG